MTSKLIKTASFLAMGITLAVSSAAFAGGEDLYKAKGCAACHGEAGAKPIMPAYPKVAGQSKEYILQQLKDIKSGARNNGQTAAMKGVVASVDDKDLEAIADYLSGLK